MPDNANYALLYMFGLEIRCKSFQEATDQSARPFRRFPFLAPF